MMEQQWLEFLRECSEQGASLLAVLHEAKRRFGDVELERQKEIAEALRLPLSRAAGVATFFSVFNGMDDGAVEEDLFAAPHSGPMLAGDPEYRAVRRTVDEHLDILALLEQGGILGRSGSGFPVAAKWKLTADTQAEEKYMVCNGSEGEGYTYKDAALLTHAPSAVIAGMALCALATGIEAGFLYVRAEYENAYRCVKRAVESAYEKGVLGDDVLGSGKRFHLTAVLGGGAYVSGEETGLLQALEGERSEPRLKPPYPGVCGLHGKPTIVNNAESFAAVTALVLSDENAVNTKLYTLSGCVADPGVYELPQGVTLQEAIDAAGGIAPGKDLKGIQLGGGATGGFAGPGALDTVLDYAGCRQKGLALGTASIHCFDKTQSAAALCRESISFLAGQSCGMCAPCRFGLERMTELLDELIAGAAEPEVLAELDEMAAYIGQSARCALGQAAPTAFVTARRAFPADFETLCKEVEPCACV
ncbi:MAG: hypothetical protein HDT38_02930 [Clostridiales bacterium]|nr:hypothetical protein [Clostridiales bacterium]